MTRTDHLLVILMEECAEVQKAAAKALRFGLDKGADGVERETNAQEIRREIAELYAVVEMLEEITDARPFAETDAIMRQKKERVEKYLLVSKRVGRLDP